MEGMWEVDALSKINEALERTEKRLVKTEEEVDAVVARMKPLEEEEDAGTLTEKKEERLAYLRKERADLRKEREDLRKEREDLRKKEEEVRRDLRSKHQEGGKGAAEERLSFSTEVVLTQMNPKKMVHVRGTRDTIMARLREAVRVDFGVHEADDGKIHFCTWLEGNASRTTLLTADLLLGICALPYGPPVRFWTGNPEEEPISPEKLTRKLEERIAQQERAQELAKEELKGEIRRLQVTSTTVAHQMAVWEKHQVLSLEEIEKRFSSSICGSKTIRKALRCMQGLKKAEKESDLQGPLVEMLKVLRLPATLWCDCSTRGITFDGRVHKIDAVLMVREGVLPDMQYIDTVFEFKMSLDYETHQRDVGLQLVQRMGYLFKAQPERQECWGVAMGKDSFFFVRCNRALDIWKSPCVLFTEAFVSLLGRFLAGPASLRGFRILEMPRLWGQPAQCLLARGHKGAVFRMTDNVVAKVTTTNEEATIDHERAIMSSLWAAAPHLVCPEPVLCDIETGSESWPIGLQMAHHSVVSVKSEDDVVDVVGSVFWRLAVLHELGYVHGDVKPSNVLRRDSDGAYLLCDFGCSVRGQGRGLVGGTPAFRVVAGLFRKCDFQCDLEGLFWTAVSLWVAVRRNKNKWKGLTETDRRAEWTVLHAEATLECPHPTHKMLCAYLCGQARTETLVVPLDVLRSVPWMESNWEEAACQIIAQKGLPACPKAILEWFSKRRVKH